MLLITSNAYTQTVDYETITKSKPLKISGVVSANGVYYKSNLNESRLPFTYFLQGTLNVSLFSFSMPISYSYSNQGENLDYQLPFNFNRLSLHPKYKWIAGHIGTVSMSFSPYTLNGHQFTGVGLDLTPKGPLAISIMGGRLLKATEDNGDTRTQPAFDRFGYGLKTEYKHDKFKFGFISFYAKDDINSLSVVPEERNILPQENLVISFEGDAKITKQFSLQAEYASTAITKDIRSPEGENDSFSITKPIFNSRTSTAYYSALRSKLNYNIGKATVGLGYERIDPGYETLGAYFFNNDFENITVDASNSFFNDKLALQINVGLQRDDLDGEKANNTNRTIGAANATLTLNPRLILSGSYSNFTTFTNVKPNQFEDINDSDLTDEALEDLDYRQLSQTANLNINYILSENKSKPQNLNINYNLNDVANEQGGIVRIGDASTFHNVNIGHTINFKEEEVAVTSAVNATYNTIGREDATTWGPTLGITKSLFEKTLSTRISTSYSESKNTGGKSQVINIRAGANYAFKKKHNFSLNAIQLFRSADKTDPLSEFTTTFGYNYAFGLKKPNIEFPKNKKEDNDTVKINYKKYNYIGIPLDLTPQIIKLPYTGEFPYLSSTKKEQLKDLEKQLFDSEKVEKKLYKNIALRFLKTLSDYTDFEASYYEMLYYAYLKLSAEAEKATYKLEQELDFLQREAAIKETLSLKDQKLIETITNRLIAHNNLLATLVKWEITPDKISNAEEEVKILRDRYLKRAFELYDSGKTKEEIIEFLEIRWADYFHKRIEK